MIPPQLSKLIESGVDMEQEWNKVASILEGLGLSGYEARAYIALVAHGYGSAETVAETARIPRTSAYKVMQSLCRKGFAISTRGRPAIYKPEAPSKVKERIFEDIAETFDRLNGLHEILRDKGEPQLVYTVAGKQRVLSKIGEVLDKATSTVMIATPTFFEIREALSRKIDNALKRGIKLTVITEPLQKVPEGAHVVRKEGLIATDVVADGQHALIAAPDLSACGFTDNASLAKHIEDFLQILQISDRHNAK